MALLSRCSVCRAIYRPTRIDIAHLCDKCNIKSARDEGEIQTLTDLISREILPAITKRVDAEVDRIKARDCGKLFVREGKRKFCSPRCQKRVYMRAYRAKEG